MLASAQSQTCYCEVQAAKTTEEEAGAANKTKTTADSAAATREAMLADKEGEKAAALTRPLKRMLALAEVASLHARVHSCPIIRVVVWLLPLLKAYCPPSAVADGCFLRCKSTCRQMAAWTLCVYAV